MRTVHAAVIILSACFSVGAHTDASTTDAKPADAPLIVGSDNGRRGGHVDLEALPARRSTNSLKKHFTIASLDHIRSAQLQLFAALRDPTDRDSYAFDQWEWIFFNLNGHDWVVRVEDLAMHRRSLFEVNWDDAHWAAVDVPDVAFLREGVNELIVWNNNPPKLRKNKLLVVAYDDGGRAQDSFSFVDGAWSNTDLNGDREGSPRGEWMIRLKLNRAPAEEQARIDSLGPDRYRAAVEAKKEFVWGLTDAMHRIFPDRPYTGPLENEWQIDAARRERESCQLVLVPVAADMLMAQVFAGDLTGSDCAVIPADAITIRLVRTAPSRGKAWPDPLPEAYPIDIRRGEPQAYWITVHVPEDAPAGEYRGELTVTSMSTGDRSRGGKPTKVVLQLRVRDFELPRLSRYQIVAPGGAGLGDYHIVGAGSSYPSPKVTRTLDSDGNLRLRFDSFDREVEAALGRGVTNFSLGLAYVGADQWNPAPFDWRVPVEGGNHKRRIWVCPVHRDDPDLDNEDIRRSRRWFDQYLGQIYKHLEAKGWTQYFWVYGADEPHSGKWTEPLTRYFARIKKLAPKLRIMITLGPTDRFGSHVDATCIMMNHLRQETVETARQYGQELWTYSCGHLNNPSLTLQQPIIAIRLWHWLQHKWGVERVLLWHTRVHAWSFSGAGADRRGDGQVFWNVPSEAGDAKTVPSIRAVMLRDGIEDREYLRLLAELTERCKAAGVDANAEALTLIPIPDDLVETQWKMTRDPEKVAAHRRAVADMIEKLQGKLQDRQ